MYEKSLNEAEAILRKEKDRLLPVRTLWEEVVRKSRTDGFEVADLADFGALMEGDQRFQLVPAPVKVEVEPDIQEDAAPAEEELEQFGLFVNDRVKLRGTTQEQAPSEEDEEVGSIRRRAFMSQKPVQEKTAAPAPPKKKRTAAKKQKPKAKNKSPAKKKKTAARPKKVVRAKKTARRGKKK
jgi:hypothetical protein